MTKYFVDKQGAYLGGFDGAEPPDGAIEIKEPPQHGLDTWDGAKWVKHVPEAPKKLLDQIIADPDELKKLKTALALAQ